MTRHLLAIAITLMLTATIIPALAPIARAGSYDGHDLAVAMLTNQSTLVSSSYWDRDTVGHRLSTVLASRGAMIPTEGTTFAWFSTGRADLTFATTNGLNPGNERGDWFVGGQYGTPRDEANLQMQLRVPHYMHFLYYDVQFYTVEYPDYIGTQYNDKLTISVNSPSQGLSTYLIDVNGGDFVLHANDPPLLGTGFNLYAQDGNPTGVDWLQTTPVVHGADAGATALVGREHPVSPDEVVTVTIDLFDAGDNQFNSGAFIDNMHFSGYAKAQIMARKTAVDLNGGLVQCGDIIEYDLTLSNIGTANQNNNPGHEFEDHIPRYSQYVPGSATCGSGTITYDATAKKVYWDGAIPSQSSVAISFQVTVNHSLINSTKISNQGTVYWDENEDGINEKSELTDDPAIDDLIDQDGDGDTGDDDPTVITVWSYAPPTTLIEDFADADDTVGGKALDSYCGQVWFETSQRDVTSNFEVASDYFFSTAQSFKTKLRASAGAQYWNYTLTSLNSELIAWSCWFTCGNSSEPADLTLDFKALGGVTIAKLKFEYVYVAGAIGSAAYQPRLSYQTASGWITLSSGSPNGYLYNGWYNLRVEKIDASTLSYRLVNHATGYISQATEPRQGPALSNLSQVVWTSNREPTVCPILFWDEHTLTLLPIS